jgi:hypothetical protein
MIWARSAKAPRKGGSWGAVALCWCTHLTRASASSTSRCSPCWRACGSSQSQSRAAFTLECPNTVTPAFCLTLSCESPVTWLVNTTNCCLARPRRFHVSSTRPAPISGEESKAARQCCQLNFPVALARSTVRNTSVRSRSWAIRRARNATRAPCENGASSAPSVPKTSCQRLSMLAVTTASASPT